MFTSTIGSNPSSDPYAIGQSYVAEINQTTKLPPSLSALIFSYSRSYSINNIYSASSSTYDQVEATKLFLSRLLTAFRRDPFFSDLQSWILATRRYNELLEWEQNVNATLQKLDNGILPQEEVVCEYVCQICLPTPQAFVFEQNYAMFLSKINSFSLLELENCLDRKGLQKEKDSNVIYGNSSYARKWNEKVLIKCNCETESIRVFWKMDFSDRFPCSRDTLFSYSAMHLVYVSDAHRDDFESCGLQKLVDQEIQRQKELVANPFCSKCSS